MLIDALTHITPDGRWYQSAHRATEERLLREMDRALVERAVVVAIADYISNDFVLQACNRHPDRLIAGASFNPARHSTPKAAAREFRNQLHDAPYGVLKLHPRFNRYDPLDPRCLAILEELARWSNPIPVWLCSMMYTPGFSLRRPVVDTLREIAVLFPTLKIVMLHAGGTWALHLAEAVRDCPNVFLDMSFTLARYAETSVWDDLRYLCMTYDRHMVFGSDFPEIAIDEAVRLVDRLTEGLAPEKKENIVRNNLEALLLK